MADFSRDAWRVRTIHGKRYLNTGTALYEILESQRTLDNQCPYKNVESGTVIWPGDESKHNVSTNVTDVISKIIRNEPWTTPKEEKLGVKQKVALQRARFDLRNGAEKEIVEKRLKDAMKDDSDSSDDEQEVQWKNIRTDVDINPDHSFSSSEEETFDADQSDDENEEKEDTLASRITDKKCGFDGSFGSNTFGLLRDNAPSGVPILNIPKADEDTGFVNVSDPIQEQYANANRTLLEQTNESADEWLYDDDGNAYYLDDDGEKVYYDEETFENEEVDENGRKIIYPTNVEIGPNGRITNRLDNELTGRTAEEAEKAQQDREENVRKGLAANKKERKTIDASRNPEPTKKKVSLGEQLNEFGLPPKMMEQLKQQGDLDRDVQEMPINFDEIAHMGVPFKSKKEKTETEKTPVQKPKERQVESAGPIGKQELLEIRAEITKQFTSLTKLSKLVDEYLLARL